VPEEPWRERAREEIGSIKPSWAARYGWDPQVREEEDRIDVYVRVRRTHPGGDRHDRHILRLRYQEDFETAGRREAFVNPDNPAEEGRQFWPDGVTGFNSQNNPPMICIEGTWGFHSVLHRERDGRAANLNRLLLAIQRSLNP
jgi:hypothetical protein